MTLNQFNKDITVLHDCLHNDDIHINQMPVHGTVDYLVKVVNWWARKTFLTDLSAWLQVDFYIASFYSASVSTDSYDLRILNGKFYIQSQYWEYFFC